MRYMVLATDYDGTLAHDGLVSDRALESLKRLRQSGRKLILVTGRELPDLEYVFPHFDLFDTSLKTARSCIIRPQKKHACSHPRPHQPWLTACVQRMFRE